MNKLVFATNNKHKLAEIKEMLSDRFEIISLDELGCTDDIPETEPTLEGNALLKAKYVVDRYGVNCFADDTGLEVEALNGAPGVYSARYAGVDQDAEKNMTKLLKELKGIENRKARFRTSIALILGGKEFYFDGQVQGYISTEKTGEKGFGYDPIFIPDGYNKSFAQLSSEEKNKISHRGKAVQSLQQFLMNR